MSNPFAAIEQSLNRASLGAVRNAVLAWGSLSARGVFGNEHTEILGMANTQPRSVAWRLGPGQHDHRADH